MGDAWVDLDLVVDRGDGGYLHPGTLSSGWATFVRRTGLPKLRFHDLRHTYATLALDSGMKPWDLSDRLGHSSVAFTLNVYRHAIKATQEQAAATAAAFILGGPSVG